MPVDTCANHTHVYTSYLLTLKKTCWAYKGTPKLPGRTGEDRALVASALEKDAVHLRQDDRDLLARQRGVLKL